MFDLEAALAAWRRSLSTNHTFTREDLDELERHLRDQIAALVKNGVSEKDAFDRALAAMGEYGDVEAEYEKVYWRKLRRSGQLRDEVAWRLSMLRNYVNLALRHFKTGYAALNIFGLAVGMAGCLLLTCSLYDEGRYDTFHAHADRIYRVTTEEKAAGDARYAHTFPAAGPALAHEMPEVVQATRLLRRGFGNHDVFQIGEHILHDPAYLYVDSSFFDVFSVVFLEGDTATALTRPNTVVITQAVAQTYFGSESPLGHLLAVPHVDPARPAHTFEITGVVEAFPPHAHVHFDFLMALETWDQGRTEGYFDNNWRVLSSYTYLLLRDDQAAAALQAKLPAFIEARMGSAIPEGFRVDLQLQPLTDIHLHSHLRDELEANSDVRNVYILGAIALVMLLIASINFINLSTARAARRATEVGVRKVVGAHRSQLIGQFLSESLLLACLALMLALALFALALPAFNTLTGKALTLGVLMTEGMPLLSLVLITLLVGLVAGSYPAFLLSAFRPALVLKGSLREGRARGMTRQMLVVTQFALSIGLMIATGVVYQQLTYMQDTKPGFDKEHLLVLEHRFRAEEREQAETLRQELLRHPGVQRVGLGAMWPTRPSYNTVALRPAASPPETSIATAWYDVGTDYLATLGIELVEGRAFSEQVAADTAALLVNEAAVRFFGWDEPLGQQVFFAEGDTPLGTVVGVVRDFHYRSLVEPVEPVVLMQNQGRAHYPIVKITGSDRAATLAYIEQVMRRMVPDRAFTYTFLDQAYEALYQSEQKLSRTLGLFALLALFVACLGLFGLATFAATQRTKEIGVRKVLGASVPGIVTLLAKDFVWLVGIAFLIAVPAAYIATQRWLDDFAYRVEISWLIFLMAGLATLAIAMLTVSYQSIKAALADPVKSLRYE